MATGGHRATNTGPKMRPAMRMPSQQSASLARPTATNTRQSLRSKDLIIRMLAEVFQVGSDEGGQIRWQQVSSSLVPISLYSRTTSKWLDYLLSASSIAAANNPANAMSPDSREFLVLLQQFHQQARSASAAQAQFRQSQQPGSEHDCIVFQIVGHDFLDGQCKRILNVKLIQPGTRLGRASDYFVYWKEQPQTQSLHQYHMQQHQQQFSASFTSSNSFVPINGRHSSGLSPNNNNNAAAAAYYNSDLQTWGLNFASINDAKLFYDICSLNLVDLDFNSEYLRQITTQDERLVMSRNASIGVSPSSMMMINHQRARSLHHQQQQQQQRQQQQQQQQRLREHQLYGPAPTRAHISSGRQQSATLKRQSSGVKCPSCRQVVKSTKIDSDRHSIAQEEEVEGRGGGDEGGEICPVHGISTNSLRLRSRSTTRNLDCPMRMDDGQQAKRVRSYSTPASPENECPVHRRRHKMDEDCNANEYTIEQQRRYLKFLQKQQSSLSRQSMMQEAAASAATIRPQKPLRGLMRASVQDEGYRSAPRQQEVTSNQVLHSKRLQKSKYLGHHTENSSSSFGLATDSRFGTASSANRSKDESRYLTQGRLPDRPGNMEAHQEIHDLSASNMERKHRQNIQATHQLMGQLKDASTSNETEILDSLVHRDVRIARARYANSKNMKEFLSLDAGRLQSTPPKRLNLSGRSSNRQQRGPKNRDSAQQPSLECGSKQSCGSSTKGMNIRRNERNPPTDVVVGRQPKATNSDMYGFSVRQDDLRLDGMERQQQRISNNEGDEGQRVATDTRRNDTFTLCNAATTTEDLPLDPQTRKRMLKLTSSEVISDHTEPTRSSVVSMICNPRDGNNYNNDNTNTNSEMGEMLAQQQRQSNVGLSINETAQSKIDRQVRAVSLGPEMADSARFRGKTARSDAGRRRSLERSTCVDLDGTSTAAAAPLPGSSFKKFARLSPLPQSAASPVVPVVESCSTSLRAPDADKRELMTAESGHNEADASGRRDADAMALGHDRFRHQRDIAPIDPNEHQEALDCGNTTTTARGPRTLGAGDGNFDNSHRPAPRRCNRMSTFKSAPDISCTQSLPRPTATTTTMMMEEAEATFGSDLEQLGSALPLTGGQRLQPNGGGRPLVATLNPGGIGCEGHHAQTSNGAALNWARTGLRMTSNLSTYAVPLCYDHMGSDRDQIMLDHAHARQYHSCPNSLRRKRRHDDQTILEGSSDTYGTSLVGSQAIGYCLRDSSGTLLQQPLMPKADRQHAMWKLERERENNPRGGGRHCDCLSTTGCLDCDSVHLNSHRTRQHQQYQRQQQHYCPNHAPQAFYHHCQEQQAHHHQHQCLGKTLAPTGLIDLEHLGSIGQQIQCGPSMHHHINNSSNSNNNNHPNAGPHNQRPSSGQSTRSPIHYGLYESDCEEYEPNDENNEPLVANDEGLHSWNRPMECCQGITMLDAGAAAASGTAGLIDHRLVKPVRGYDQTMSRASLKSRQRAKSQPPRGSADEYPSYLSKSVENVEKLIKEVQHELDSLKRHPLGKISIGFNEKITGPRDDVSSCTMCTEERQQSSDSKGRPLRSDLAASEVGSATTTAAAAVGANRVGRLSTTSATRRAGQFKCSGAIRKAGFLSVKKWILRRRRSIELARRQGWKRYWVCLRGTALLFHPVVDKQELAPGDSNQTDLLSWIQTNCGSQFGAVTSLLKCENQQQDITNEAFLDNIAQCYIEREPKHLIIIDGAIAQPIPEHPRRDYVFCLSTTFGDAYLFQASCQLESDNWISAMHNACAASIARDLTRDDAIKLFENKIRRLELEAEKKLFLRQRLESRLTSMSSMSRLTSDTEDEQPAAAALQQNISNNNEAMGKHQGSSKVTLRALLQRLSQQLYALDSFMEQLHCEVYQLRCYLSSCGSQRVFYQSFQPNQHQEAATTSGGNLDNKGLVISNDLPHPKSLLMHVSKPTKLLLIRMGVFTVSSFHAYIHARQESAESIVQQVQQQQASHNDHSPSSPIELRIRSHSITENLLSNRNNNLQKLDCDTEKLLELANLKLVIVHLDKSLYSKIKDQYQQLHQQLRHHHHHQPGTTNPRQMTRGPADGHGVDESDTSGDDRHSIRDEGEIVVVDLRLNAGSTSLTIVKQVLKLIVKPINPTLLVQNEFDFLNYYLQLVASSKGSNHPSENRGEPTPVKHKETLKDWLEFDYIEMLEKRIYRVELMRSRLDEEAGIPFGISVEGQLFIGQLDSQLNVYCNYIEWGSVADKAGLKDEDELLMVNGIPIGDLDMMFVECILQEATKLDLVVRYGRSELPSSSANSDTSAWKRAGGGGHDRDDDNYDNDDEYDDNDGDYLKHYRRFQQEVGAEGSQVISDEHITSLVCPPPPSRSDAFLRTDPNLIRQKSDLCLKDNTRELNDNNNQDYKLDSLDCNQEFKPVLGPRLGGPGSMPKAVSQLDLNRSGQANADEENALPCQADNVVDDHGSNPGQACSNQEPPAQPDESTGKAPATLDGDTLVQQLLTKTERLTRLVGGSEKVLALVDSTSPIANSSPKLQATSPAASSLADNSLAEADQNSVERLRKSILELLETEHAYIRHLETINDHYMTPLEEANYLGIADLRLLNESLVRLTSFQRDFFDQLTSQITSNCGIDCGLDSGGLAMRQQTGEDYARLNGIIQYLSLLGTKDQLRKMLESISSVFLLEAPKFKDYALYCVAYSRLQRILHPPAKASAATNAPSSHLPGSSILSMPAALNTFTAGTMGPNVVNLSLQQQQQHQQLYHHHSHQQQQRDSMSSMSAVQRAMSSLLAGNSATAAAAASAIDLSSQQRQLNDFLGSLDSSSSSVSLSLTRSSTACSATATTGQQQQQQQHQSRDLKDDIRGSSTRSLSKQASGDQSLQSHSNSSQSSYRGAHQQNFESYLIKPIQRIVKYPMLLNCIALCSSQLYSMEEQVAFCEDIQRAVRQMESVIGHVNDTQRVHDDYGLVFEQIERQFYEQKANESSTTSTTVTSSASSSRANSSAICNLFGPHQPPVSLNISQLLCSGPVGWLNTHEFTSKVASGKQNKATTTSCGRQLSQILFVFNSCVVLICKERIKPPTTTLSGANKKRLPTLASVGSQNLAGSSAIVANTPGSGHGHARGSSTTTFGNSANVAGAASEGVQEIIRYQTLIPVSEVQVRSVQADAKNGGHQPSKKASSSATNDQELYQWELFQCSSSNSNSSLLIKSSQTNKRNKTGRVYLLSCATNEERSAFLRIIRFTIRESVRNMNLPVPRSPSSTGLASKKLSTSSTSSNGHSNNSTCSQASSLATEFQNRDPVCQAVKIATTTTGDIARSSGNIDRNLSLTTRAVPGSAKQQQPTQYKNGIEVNN